MNEKNGKNPLMALTVATMLFAALGVIVYSPAPYKGIRPSAPLMQEPPEKIRARLWQDPFQAVLDELKARGPTPQPGMAAQQHGETKKSNKKAAVPHNPQIFAGQLATLKQEIAEHQELGNVTVLGVVVFGGPYAEMVESRLGHRYAVLSGLNILKYYPEDEGHISYLRILDAGRGQVTGSPGDQENLSNIIPYEWLSSEKEKASILLLWLNEDIFSEPLTQLTSLHADLNNLEFKIIGPPSSHSLVEIYKELLIKNKEIEPNMTIYLATATAGEKGLLQEVFKQYPSQEKDKFNKKYSDFNKEWFKYLFQELKNKTTVKLRPGTGELENLTSSKIEHTILSDRKLATALIDELANRNVDLIQPCGFPRLASIIPGFFGKSYDCFNAERDHVVLVSEWDTFYGRTLPETFKDVVREKLGLSPETEIPWIHRFSYLRGIDGKLPEEKKDGDKEKRKNDASSQEDRDIKKLEEPVGRSQYDYLRRLAERIGRLDDTLQYEHKGSIQAIGVLGNDFYDKFLVLQALRQRFPDRIFFTTDLDANYFHPANIEWTRNLVVASTYGLQLHEDLQKDVPPFRNAYQTSVFAATLRAFHFRFPQGSRFLEEHDFKDLKPRIFEIGRHNAIDLTGQVEDPGPINQVIAAEGFPYRDLVNLMIAILFISILAMFLQLSCTSDTGIVDGIRQFSEISFTIPPVIKKPKSIIKIWLMIVGFILISVAIFYLLIISHPTEEPFSWSEGISIWPTEIIRFTAFILSLFFLYLSSIRLKANNKIIYKEYDLEHEPANIANTKSTNPTIANTLNVNAEWMSYLKRSHLRKRIKWIIAVFVVYFSFCCLIIYFFGLPATPVRGTVSRWVNIVVLIFTIISFLCLTFFVLDIIMLCQRFIAQFFQNQPRWDPNSLKQFIQKWILEPGPSSQNPDSSQKDAGQWKGGKVEAALSDWMLVQLIARRTDVVGKLIFYPFIVWSLIIISRFHYFDNWQTPLGLAIVISMSALLAWGCAVYLRRSAEKLRTVIINRLDREIVGVLAIDQEGKEDTNLIQHVLNEVRDIKTGAFASYVQQPVLQSLLVPLGSISGVKILELLSNLG